MNQYDAIESILGNEQNDIPSNVTLIEPVAQLVMDLSSWAKAADILNPWVFLPEEIRARILQTILKPGAYQDMLAQLYIWGSLRERGISSKLIERPGMPDLLMYCPDGDEIGGEVKCVRSTSAAETVKSAVKKANSQLKTLSASKGGTLFVRVLRHDLLAVSDETPGDVKPIVALVGEALNSQHNRQRCAGGDRVG